MNAWIVAVGSELLTPFRIDTNSLAITERLNAIGVDVRAKMVVSDNLAALVEIFGRAVGAIELVVCTGGLGPTEDDVTRDALAAALGVPLDQDDAILDGIRKRFDRRGLIMPAINARQALVPRGAVVLPNAHGTAPGLCIERDGTTLVLLPGPSREMTPMLDALIEWNRQRWFKGAGLFRRVLKVTGLSESHVDALASPVYRRWLDAEIPIATTILASMGQIELQLTASGEEAVAASALASAVEELREVLGDAVYSTDGRALEVVVGDLLRQQKLTVAVAESCSGGLLASRLTDVPGSSEYFNRGAVCYSNDAKIEWLDVPPEMLAEHGAVSEPVARAMADGIRRAAGADAGIGITGIAGPGGGSPQKPVGTVAIAVAAGDEARVRTYLFSGPRDMIKFQATQAALNTLRLILQAERPQAAID